MLDELDELDELGPLGPPAEDLEARRLRDAAGRALFGDDAPDLMRIGRFELQDEIGTGGQGQVYLVRDPRLDRMVALKRLGTGSPEHVERMRREAQALAKVSHDNVVTIFEVGEDETGRPFLVMELLDGRPLDQWLAAAHRHWTEIVDVFIAVGEGLAAIHAAELVHRDLKPSNIVVDERGRAKLIDLGLAEPASERLAAEDTRDRYSARMGTWSYMAPEQQDGRPSTKSDLFGLCLVLHEALHGTRPAHESTGPPTVRSADASASGSPSGGSKTMVQVYPRAADGLGGAPKRLTRAITRGLHPDPAQRHETVQALVAELRRVRAPSRRRIALAFGGLGLAVLGLVLTSSPEPSLCDESRPAAALWDGAPRDAVRDGFTTTDRPEAEATFEAVDAMLARSTRALDEDLEATCERTPSPALRAIALTHVHQQHLALRALIESLAHVEPDSLDQTPVRLAASLSRLTHDAPEACGREPAPSAESLAVLDSVEDALRRATAEATTGRYDDAMERSASALELAQDEALALHRAKLHLARGQIAFDARRLTEARDELERARSLAERLDCDGMGAQAMSLWAKAQLLDPQPEVELAEYATRQALEKLDGLGDRGSHRRAQALDARGLTLRHQGDTEAAIEHHARALAVMEELHPRPILALADTHLNLAVAQARAQRTDEAIETLERARSLREDALWADHPSLYLGFASLSNRHLERGDLESAGQALDRALELVARMGDDHPQTAQLHIAKARVLDWSGDFTSALEHAEQADAILRRAHGSDSPQRVASLEAIGQVLIDANDPLRATPSLEKSLELQVAAGRPAVDQAIGRGKLAMAHAQAGNHEVARPLLEHAWLIFSAEPAMRDDPFGLELQLWLGETLLALDDGSEAVEPLRAAVQGWETQHENPERLAHARWGLARAMCPSREGEVHARRSLESFEQHQNWTGTADVAREIRAWLEQPCAQAP